ncbi:hypothetical protein Tco_0971986 [Tanacetum coccineum]
MLSPTTYLGFDNDETSDDSVVDDNFPGQTLMEVTTNDTPVYTSPSTLIGGDPRKNDTVDMKEAQGNKAYTLEVLTKEARPVTNPHMDSHTGNPCDLKLIKTKHVPRSVLQSIKEFTTRYEGVCRDLKDPRRI